MDTLRSRPSARPAPHVRDHRVRCGVDGNGELLWRRSLLRGPPPRPVSRWHCDHSPLPEDADFDGLVDHVSVYVPDGINRDVQAKLDRITRLWEGRRDSETQEWRLALEGFGQPGDFSASAAIFGRSRCWRSATPFLSAGHLKSDGHAGEFRRLAKRTGMDDAFGFDAAMIEIRELKHIPIGGSARHALHFHRFRSRGREKQRDTAGALLEVLFPGPVNGPIAMGYGCHFGLGLFSVA